jgi:hypothetical protein
MSDGGAMPGVGASMFMAALTAGASERSRDRSAGGYFLDATLQSVPRADGR